MVHAVERLTQFPIKHLSFHTPIPECEKQRASSPEDRRVGIKRGRQSTNIRAMATSVGRHDLLFCPFNWGFIF